MKGKKIDMDFLSNFIQDCVLTGIVDSKDIVDQAKLLINNIDLSIKELEKQKVKRSKLLGVVESLQNSEKINKQNQSKLLPFFRISRPDICKNICEGLKTGVVYLNDDLDVIFCIKQMIELKIVAKIGDHLVRGSMFDNYVKFIIKEI